MKVLHFPNQYFGQAALLANAEKPFGAASRALSFLQGKDVFSKDLVVPVKKNMLAQFFTRFKAFCQVKNQFDVYHFNGAQSLVDFPRYGVNLNDLPYYNAKSVKVMSCYTDAELSAVRLKKIEEVCQHFFCYCPKAFSLLPKEKTTFLPFLLDDNAFDLPIIDRCFKPPLTIAYIGDNAAVSRLELYAKKQKEALSIIEITDLQDEAELILATSASIFIDFREDGWYEPMHLYLMRAGVPIFKVIDKRHLSFLPKDYANALPFVAFSGKNLLRQIDEMVNNSEKMTQLSVQTKAFYNTFHNSEYVAHRTTNIYLKLREASCVV